MHTSVTVGAFDSYYAGLPVYDNNPSIQGQYRLVATDANGGITDQSGRPKPVCHIFYGYAENTLDKTRLITDDYSVCLSIAAT